MRSTTVAGERVPGDGPDEPQTAPVVRASGLRKQFGDVIAVDGLELSVPAGTCFGLLGPNGAGKTTTMRLLLGQSTPDAGSIDILGYEIPRERKHARIHVGVVSQQDTLDEELTVRENLDVFARLYRVPRRRRTAAVDQAMALAGLTERVNTLVHALSGGMRRRLLVARALVHQPRLVLLDEPTVGLDPQVRHELWALIEQLRADGVTLIMTTHYIEEAERLSDAVALMVRGDIVDQGSPADLRRLHAGGEAVEFYGPPHRLDEIAAAAAAANLPTRRVANSIAVLRAEEDCTQRLVSGIDMPAQRRPSTLEDVFVLRTGETIE
ncbi:Nod factor export ATP-binding protein I [Longimycelium tulufanense]|uniref:Nod factor export ATP-binding protein I n=1 Tax=Longimycelium tulufanense TaxID=907463 RepID=A0A8J3CKR9_9PSEU|nr:ABC transporter ATP-binding protein [Longimycelium tulufanense]GGM83684.1 Nod factor export ATP-binding protein I [Longimycelium tulufanense]